MKGIASGLAYLHTQNVVHSDMKSVRLSTVPESPFPQSHLSNSHFSLHSSFQGNVLISPSGEPLVTDFGISHMLASGTYGTMRWMAYEQINVDAEDGLAATRTPYTFQTDVWAFGMTVLVRFPHSTVYVKKTCLLSARRNS